MKVILASNNAHKLVEFRALFRTLQVELLSMKDAGIDVDPEETGETFAENAFIKAEAVMKASGLPAIADDSGLCVDALGGAPGVHSARYTGSHADSDADRYTKLLRDLEGVTDRSARFVSALCCVFPNGDCLRTEGTLEGTILYTPRGSNGFGYDPVFQPLGYDRSNAELSLEEKNAISHRGKALKKMKEEWENYHADK